MPNNPSPDEPTEVIEPLQPKSAPQTSVSQPSAASQARLATAGATSQSMDANSGDTQNREEALTIKFAIEKLNDYLQWFLMVLEAVLFIRFILMMFGADPQNPFAAFVYGLTGALLIPFGNIIPSIHLHDNQAFEFSTLFAALIYFLIFFALKRFLRILVSNPGEQEG